MKNCPCGNEVAYDDCCGLLITGASSAKTAEQLMRSRYTAFHNREITYIASTCWPQINNPKELAELRDSVESTHWLALKICDCTQGKESDLEGSVTFEATYCENEHPDQPHILKEQSFFVKHQNAWFYSHGKLSIRELNLGRNDLCWCGSGKKHKKCHG